jgi:hypothetical protein
MDLAGKVKDFLKDIEVEEGKCVSFSVSATTSGIRDLQVIAYPTATGSVIHTFSLRNGLSPTIKREIRHWFERFLELESERE